MKEHIDFLDTIIADCLDGDTEYLGKLQAVRDELERMEAANAELQRRVQSAEQAVSVAQTAVAKAVEELESRATILFANESGMSAIVASLQLENDQLRQKLAAAEAVVERLQSLSDAVSAYTRNGYGGESATMDMERENVKATACLHEAIVTQQSGTIPRHLEVSPNGAQRCYHCDQWIFSYPCGFCGYESELSKAAESARAMQNTEVPAKSAEGLLREAGIPNMLEGRPMQLRTTEVAEQERGERGK